jgi:hypothetical protein
MADAALTPGAYGPFRAVDPTTKAIFDKAMAGLLGVGYRPLIVASQVVAGTNYLSLCAMRKSLLPARRLFRWK